jgi:hypothetical protein
MDVQVTPGHELHHVAAYDVNCPVRSQHVTQATIQQRVGLASQRGVDLRPARWCPSDSDLVHE